MPRGIRCGLGAGVDRSSGLGIHCSVGIGGTGQLGGLAALRDDAVAVAELDLEGERAFCGPACEEAVNVKGRRATEDVFRAGEDVVYVGRRNDAERDLAIYAAEGEVVNLVAKWRDVG